MRKLKLEARYRVEQNQMRGHEIIEYAEQNLEEARQINSSSHLPIFDLDEDEDFNYTKDSRLEANGVCGKGGISESSQILAAIEAIDLDDVFAFYRLDANVVTTVFRNLLKCLVFLRMQLDSY